VSPSGDRVAVPTNGHHPAMSEHPDDAVAGTDSDVDENPSVAADFGAGATVAERGARSTVPTVTPAQLAAGFGIIAALILLVLGRRRGRRG
jgi:hypothetical protein